MGPARAFVDTNVFVYAYQISTDERSARAGELLAELGRDRRGVVSIQVLKEFYVTMMRKARFAEATADGAFARLQMLSRWPVHSPIAEDVVAAASLAAEAQLSLWDAMIVRSAERMGCSVLWTEDLTHGRIIAGVAIRNPFHGLRPTSPEEHHDRV